ncbi:uncharacterized protein ACN2A1_001382 isoform 2-T2 [Glossina fuscipes fuscipes]
MPPKRRRRFQGIYYHSSPPKVFSMNGQISNGHDRKRKREVDDFSVKLSTIRIWMHEKDIGKLTRILWAGQGNRLRQQASTNSKVKRFLSAVPYVMNSVKDVHQAVIDNSLENLQTHLEPPVPPALVTCRDANGLNLIHKAAGLGHATILEYLIATWPDGVHETDITGKTPLHWAASAKNNMRCYTLLTQAGCDEEVLDYRMKTPTYYRHKPNEIERAFLTYVPEAPRVSPGIATDWEALSDDSGDGKKRDIKIPELNGFGRHSITESNENTSEAEVTEGLEQISEDNRSDNPNEEKESAENANDSKAEEQSTDGNAEDQEASSEEVENTAKETKDPEEDNEEDKEKEQQSEKQSEIINDCITGTVIKDRAGSEPGETDENEEYDDNDDIENETEVVTSNEVAVDTPESDIEQDKISEAKKEKEIDDGVIDIDTKIEAPLHKELDQNSDIEGEEKNEDSSGLDDADKNDSNKEDEDENDDEAKSSSDSDQEIKDEKLIKIDQLSLPENDKLDSEDSEHTSEDDLKDHENQKTEEDENNNTKDAEMSEEEQRECNGLEYKTDDDKAEENGTNKNENGMKIKEFVQEIETNHDMQIDEATSCIKKAENALKRALSADKSDTEQIDQSDVDAEDDSKEVIIMNSENNLSVHDKAELNEKNYKDHFNMKSNNESENENESESEDDEETNNNNNNSDDRENGKELTENNESTDKETELNDHHSNQDDEQMTNGNGEENVAEEEAAEEKAVEEEADAENATEEEAAAEKAAVDEVAEEEVVEYGDNEKSLQRSTLESAERDAAVTPSLAIEGFVAGASEDNTVQSQTAAIDHNEKELQLQQIVAAGDMEKLAEIVLNGDGEKLSNLEATEPEVQAFLNNVPNYMNKIQRVHKAARNGSLLSLQQALDRRKFAISRDNISPNGATPLHVATLFGHSDILRYLASRFPETTSATDFDERTPLHYAAVINDNGHFYNLLLKLGANPKIEDKLGKTAEQYRDDDKLRDILNYRQLLMLFNAEELESQLLSDQGQIENHSFENNPLFKTEQGKYLADTLAEPLIKALTQIVNKRPADPLLYLTNYLQSYVKTRNSNGRTITTTQAAVHTGSGVSHVARNESSIEKQNGNAFMNGIDGDAAGNHLMENLEETEADDTKKMEERDEHGQSRLHFACARSNRKGALINLIEESLIDITYRDELYRTARDVSLQANQLGNAKEIDRYVFSLAVVGDVKPFEHLAVSGYDHIIDIYDDNDASIIDVAEQRGNTQIATFLRALRSMEELREELHQMIRDNRVERVKEIVDVPNGKWFIKAKNYYGRTALHIAILKESVEIVEHFVDICPESLKIGDNLERSPLHYAMGTSTIESISRILIQNGAKRTCKDLKGRQPSYYFMNKADVLRLQEEEDENR